MRLLPSPPALIAMHVRHCILRASHQNAPLHPPFSQVRLSIDRFTGQRYACKIVDKKKFLKHAESSKRPLKSDALLQEVAIMQQLSHPNIVRIFECFETSSSLYIILELLQVQSCVCMACSLAFECDRSFRCLLFLHSPDGLPHAATLSSVNDERAHRAASCLIASFPWVAFPRTYRASSFARCTRR